MPSAEFEPVQPSQTYVFDRTTTGIGTEVVHNNKIKIYVRLIYEIKQLWHMEEMIITWTELSTTRFVTKTLYKSKNSKPDERKL
jgi:hypothetical protein